MAPIVDKLMAPGPGHPALRVAEEAHQALNVAVVVTSVHGAHTALREAGSLASQLGARITLIVPEIVPYVLPLESPAVPVEFIENSFAYSQVRALLRREYKYAFAATVSGPCSRY
jgi:hypothetical protein